MKNRKRRGFILAVVLMLSGSALMALAESQAPAATPEKGVSSSVPPASGGLKGTSDTGPGKKPSADGSSAGSGQVANGLAGGGSLGSAALLPEKLDEALDSALRNNPDLLLAQANVQAAEAQLNKARLEVVRDVSQAYRTRQSLRDSVSEAERRFAEGRLDLKALTDAKILRAESDAKLQYLLGSRAPSGGVAYNPSQGFQAAVSELNGQAELAPRPVLVLESLPYAKALQERTAISFTDVQVSAICEFIQTSFNLNVVAEPEVASTKIHRLEATDSSIVQILQIILDSSKNGLCVLFRDYGVLITTVERAQLIPAPCLPPYVPLYISGRIVRPKETGFAGGGQNTPPSIPAPPAAALPSGQVR